MIGCIEKELKITHGDKNEPIIRRERKAPGINNLSSELKTNATDKSYEQTCYNI